MSMTKLGGKSKTIFLKGPEAHKLHNEFEVKTAKVSVSQPVVLNADGTVSPAAAAAKKNTIIGYSIHNGQPGELVTVAMVGFTMIYAMNTAALNAGPVKVGAMSNVDPDYLTVSTATDATDQVGWAIDAATAANDIVRVVLF